MVSPSLLIAIPLAGAFAAPLIALRSKGLTKCVPPLALAADLVIGLLLLPRVLQKPIVVSIGGFPPPFCINLMVGPLGLSLAILISLVGLLISIYAVGYIKTEPSERYHVLYLLLATGALGTVLTGDIFNLFVFFEILCIASYGLTAFDRSRSGTEAAMKYLIQGTVGSTCILVAIGFLYGLFGTLNMADIAARVPSADPLHLFVILAFFLVGFGVEAAVFPLNAWLPDAHSSAPSSVSAILSGIAIKTGVYAIARVSYTLMNAQGSFLFLSLIGIITLVVGEVAAYRQKDDIKRMLAYSSVGQIGLIVFAIGVGTSLGVFGALFQLVSHALAKCLLFLAAGYMIYRVGSRKLADLEGLGRKMPLTAVAFTVAAFSLVGLPPFAGFLSKLSIVCAALKTQSAAYFGLAAVALAATVIEAGYFFRVVQGLYFRGGERSESALPVREAPAGALIPILLLAALVVAIGVYPRLVTDVLEGAARELLDRGAYIRDVLGAM
jgi:proton-translocating NADH-quinone oxidoreductase chain N